MDAKPSRTGQVNLIDGLGEIANSYNVVLSNVWGVVHNGVAAWPEACEALTRFRDGGRRSVVLISNAPRPGTSVMKHLDQLGVPREAYDGIVTSGDVTRASLQAHPGAAVLHIGPDRDLPVFKGLDVSLVGAEEAGLVVNTGLANDETESPDDYRDLLRALARRRLEMICANPDIVVERGDRLVWCAGALAEIYESEGGAVVWAGKPHAPIYERALNAVAEVAGSPADPTRVLAIGDSVRTDMAGAERMGIDALFVAEGIHGSETGRGAELDAGVLSEMFASAGVSPRAVMTRLAW